jgi:hypothetical protein
MYYPLQYLTVAELASLVDMYVRYQYQRWTEHHHAALVCDGQISESYSRDEIVDIFCL